MNTMKKVVDKNDTSSKHPHNSKKFLLLGIGIFLAIFLLLPITLSFFKVSTANIARIPIEGIITSNGESYLGQSTISSATIVEFIHEAEENPIIEAIILEINSPGGTPVGSDEIASAVKKAEKPVIAVIRETGASGAYWIASAADHIVANRMSITGSIGVVSSYLEFSGFMEKYGIGYERLVAGKYKDLGVPYKKLSTEEEQKMQMMLDKIHDFFIEEVSVNRKLEKSKVTKLATGEVFLGIEAVELGLVDQLGDLETAQEYLQDNYNLTEIETITYAHEKGLFDVLAGMSSSVSYRIGEGIGSVFLQTTEQKQSFMMIR